MVEEKQSQNKYIPVPTENQPETYMSSFFAKCARREEGVTALNVLNLEDAHMWKIGGNVQEREMEETCLP